MKLLIKLIFILSLIVISCSEDEKTNDCKTDGCKDGYFCNTEKNYCQKKCTQAYCDGIGEKCNADTGLCEPWCTVNEDCDENSRCNANQKCELFFITINDKNLDKCIKEEFNISYDKKISVTDLESIKKLECPNRNISDLNGIEYLKNLEKLSLWENNITDISKLAALTKIKTLQLGFNNINNIDILAYLINIENLSLADNNLEDVSVLGDLTELKWLNLDNNSIRNINFLMNLTSLKWLTLENNPILDANTTITQLKHNGAEVYYKIDNKKQLKNINLMQSAVNNKIINYESHHIIPPETYVRTTSDTSYNRLEKFILESPNQEDAGSCLYMANTGAMEMILNQITDKEIKNDGDTDISERYLMNSDNYARSIIDYTMTDLIRTFNYNKGALLNRDYPFTVGWVKKDASGHRTESAEGVEGAEFTAEYNWINKLPDNWRELLIPTPKVTRTILFLDPNLNSNSIWNVGIMNDDVINRVKYELRTKNAPVVVIYNHYLVWHTVVIVGYDDEAGFGEECPMVTATLKYFREKGKDSYADKIEARINADGGCSKKGIFYVRDSISDGDKDTAIYHYGGNVDFEDSYSKKIVYHSYDWLKYLGNHAYSVHRVK